MTSFPYMMIIRIDFKSYFENLQYRILTQSHPYDSIIHTIWKIKVFQLRQEYSRDQIQNESFPLKWISQRITTRLHHQHSISHMSWGCITDFVISSFIYLPLTHFVPMYDKSFFTNLHIKSFVMKKFVFDTDISWSSTKDRKKKKSRYRIRYCEKIVLRTIRVVILCKSLSILTWAASQTYFSISRASSTGNWIVTCRSWTWFEKEKHRLNRVRNSSDFFLLFKWWYSRLFKYLHDLRVYIYDSHPLTFKTSTIYDKTLQK